MIYPLDFESKVGFDSIRRMVSDKCQTRLGKDEVSQMAFSSDFVVVNNRLTLVDEMMRILSEELPFPSGGVHDVIPYLTEIKALGSYMSAERLYKLSSTLMAMAEVEDFFRKQTDEETGASRFPTLNKEFSEISNFPSIVSEIRRARLSAGIRSVARRRE